MSGHDSDGKRDFFEFGIRWPSFDKFRPIGSNLSGIVCQIKAELQRNEFVNSAMKQAISKIRPFAAEQRNNSDLCGGESGLLWQMRRKCLILGRPGPDLCDTQVRFG